MLNTIEIFNAEKKYGIWTFKMSRNIDEIREYIGSLIERYSSINTNYPQHIMVGEAVPLKIFNKIFTNEEMIDFPIEISNGEILLDVNKAKPDTIYSINFCDCLIGLRYTKEKHLELFSIDENQVGK